MTDKMDENIPFASDHEEKAIRDFDQNRERDESSDTGSSGELRRVIVPVQEVGEFIETLKRSPAIPPEIYADLDRAMERVHVDIPEPPEELWDRETELIGDQPQGSAELIHRSLKKEFDEELHAVKAPLPDRAHLRIIRNDGSIASGQDEANLSEPPLAASGLADRFIQTDLSKKSTAQSQSEAKERPTSGALWIEAKAPSERNEPSQKEEQNEPNKQGEANKQAAPNKQGEAEDFDRAIRFFLGRKNLVNATATLIVIHSLILFVLEFLWKRLPATFLTVPKDGFGAFLLATAAVQGLSLLLPIVLTNSIYRIPAAQITGRSKIDRTLILAAALMGIPASLFFNGLNNMFIYAVTSWDIWLPGQILPTWAKPENSGSLLAMIMVAAVVPSILEELFFRGFLQKAFYGLKSIRLMLFAQAFFFAFYHNDPLFFVAPLGAGILLGMLRRDSESLLPAILCHLIMNISTFVLDPILPRFSAQMVLMFPAEGQASLIANIVATLSSGLVLVLIYRFLHAYMLRKNRYAGFSTGRRAAFYGRNDSLRQIVHDSPDQKYRAPEFTFENYYRLIFAIAIWLLVWILQ